MKIIIPIYHPAWAHQYTYLIKHLGKNHQLFIFVIEKGNNTEILQKNDIKYTTIGNTTGNNLLEKGVIFITTFFKILYLSLKIRPDLYFGRACPMMALTSFLIRKKHIVFEDTEHAFISLRAVELFSSELYTPVSFRKTINKRHHKIRAFKELFYLHPSYFQADAKYLKKLSVSQKDKYFILRFVSWDAHHDIGKHGISYKGRLAIISLLSTYGKVFISSETALPPELKKYELPHFSQDMHHILSFAHIYIGESATMASESAILGTPSVLIHSGAIDEGNMIYFEQKYDMMYTFADEKKAMLKIEQLLKNTSLKKEWQQKRKVFLKHHIDPNTFFIKKIDSL